MDTVRRTCSRTAADGQLTKDGSVRCYADTETRTQGTQEVFPAVRLSGYPA